MKGCLDCEGSFLSNCHMKWMVPQWFKFQIVWDGETPYRRKKSTFQCFSYSSLVILAPTELKSSSDTCWNKVKNSVSLKNNSFVIDLVSLTLWCCAKKLKLNFAFLCANESEYYCFETKKLFQKKLTDEEKMSSTKSWVACIIRWKIKILLHKRTSSKFSRILGQKTNSKIRTSNKDLLLPCMVEFRWYVKVQVEKFL